MTDIGWAALPVIPSLKGFSSQLTAGIAGPLQKSGKSAGGKFGKAFAVGAAAVIGAAAGLYKIGETFDQVRDTIVAGTGASGKALDGLAKSVDKIATKVPTDFKTASQAVADLNTLTGATGKTLEGLTSSVLEASRILGEDGTANAKAFGQALNQWQVPAEQGASQVNKLFKVTQDYGIGLNEVTAQLTEYGSVLQNAGFNMDESAVLFGKLNKSGLSVSRIMPGLNMAFRKWAEAGKDSRTELAATITKMQDASTSTEALAIATETFGAEGAQRLVTAVRTGAFSLDDLSTALNGSESALADASKGTQSFSEKWQILKNKAMVGLKPLALGVFDALSAVGDWMIDHGVPALQKFADWIKINVIPIVKQWVEVFKRDVLPVLQLVGGFIVTAFKAAFDFIRENADWMAPILAGFAAATVALKVFQALWASSPFGVILLAVAAVAGFIIQNWDTIKQYLSDAWNWIASTAQTVWGWIKSYIINPVLDVWNWLVMAWTTVGGWLSTAWEGIKTAANSAWGFIKDYIINPIASAWHWLVNTWNSISRFLSSLWNSIGTTASAVWWGIKDAIALATNAIIWVLNKFIDGLNLFVKGYNAVMEPFKLAGVFDLTIEQIGHIDPIPQGKTGGAREFAKGGIVKARPGGTLALIGEGGRDEAVIPLSGGFNAQAAQSLINQSNGIGETISSKANSWLTDSATNQFGSILSFGWAAAEKKFGALIGASALANSSAGGGAWQGGGGGSAQVGRWVSAAMAMTGVPANWHGPLVSLAMHESGGNPNAINLWDSNAAKGIPSKGLFQTIDPTFNAYSMGGSIYDPVANAVAAIRYILARYGSIFQIASYTPTGFVGGYEKGTDYVPRTGFAYLHKGEAVLTAEENRRRRGDVNVTLNSVRTLPTERELVSVLRTVDHLHPVS